MRREQKKILDFHNGIGGWRISKYEDIKLPSVEYEIAKMKRLKYQLINIQSLKLKMNTTLIISLKLLRGIIQ